MRILMLSAALLTSGGAHAIEFTSRSGSYSVVASCPGAPLEEACPSVPNSFPVEIIGSYPYVDDWAPATTSVATETLASAPYGLGQGRTERDPGLPLPVVRALALTPHNEDGRYSVAYAQGSTIFAYTWTGTEPVPLPLVGELDFSVSFAPINFADPFAAGSFPYSFGSAEIRLAVFTRDFYVGQTLFPSAVACGVPGVIASGSGVFGRGGFASGGVTQNVSESLGLTNDCAGNPLMLNPGDEVYIHAFLAAYAQRGAITDVRNTFRIALAEGTSAEVREAIRSGLTLSVVPEPASWALMICGFGAVGAALRRRGALLES